MSDSQAKIQASTKSVSDLLGKKYSIDFYQREYSWQRRHIEDLRNDLIEKFLIRYDKQNERPTVINTYPHYFLGTIITTVENGQRYIVDGQQRLTTITLLLIFLRHCLKNEDDVLNCRSLIYSSKGGVTSFNINVEERVKCLQALFQQGAYSVGELDNLSVKNLVARYEDIEELFTESLQNIDLSYFYDWLTENIDLVEIEAFSDDDAFTIFETMNDRGLSLGQSDMLKGYLLANINSSELRWTHQKKTQANDIWKKRIREFDDLEGGDTDDFFRTWLRSNFAQSIREGKKDAVNKDFENINKFHRWVRDNKELLGLNESQEFYDFITDRMQRYARHYITLRRAAHQLTPGLEAVNYNAHNNFTLQYILALAPLRLDDDCVTVKEKMRLVTIFADIYFVRRVVNFKNTGYSSLRYSMFNLTKEIRDKSLVELRAILLKHLNGMWEKFSGLHNFFLHGRNKKHLRYLLARMTAWVEQKSGNPVNYRQFLWDAKGKPFEIEHIWANKYKEHGHGEDYDHEYDFQRERDYFGGLILLPKGLHKVLLDKPYEQKLKNYLNPQSNLLAASLHSQTHENKTSFKDFMAATKLPFKPHAQFKRADLLQRQELYRQICEQIWHPDRLNAI